MGYYADLIKEKRNARDYDEINKLSKEIKQIVSELRRKYTHIRQTDDVNFLLDVLHDRGQQIPQSDKNKAEHAMQLDETRRRMSVAPRDWGFGNEKEEEGYYAKLAKEKKNTNPEDSMRKLQALKPIVEAFKRKGMTRHEVDMRLMQERDITETLAQQCVDTWY